jgi:hypothetical protein
MEMAWHLSMNEICQTSKMTKFLKDAMAINQKSMSAEELIFTEEG